VAGRPTVGVLALQGDVREHLQALAECDCQTRLVRAPEDLVDCIGLIMPGGESTTIGKLIERTRLDQAIKRFAADGGAMMGTCAGLILMAKEVKGEQARLGLLDITIARNAYGRQVDSFEADLEVPSLGESPFHGVFIRAPWIERVGSAMEVLGSFESRPVVVREGKLLGLAFHPELTQDRRLHRLFLNMCNS